MEQGTRGVLLLNLGGPDTLGAVRPFLYNLFSDREIIPLGPTPFQKPIAWSIALLRSGKTRSAYRLIGGGSPIRTITDAQAAALAAALRPQGDFSVRVGMRYWHPFIEATIRQMYEEGIRDMLALSLYPHYSKATTGSAYAEVARCLRKYPIRCVFAEPWFDDAGYVYAIAETVREASGEPPGEINLLFSAHSLPQSFIEDGDPYVDHIQTTVRLVNEALDSMGFRVRSFLSYQSRSGPVKWLEPSTEKMIASLGEKGIRDVLVVPVSFVSDHIETLYEIDMLYHDLARDHGVVLRRVDSLNTRPEFIGALREVVMKSLGGSAGGGAEGGQGETH